MRTAGRDSTRNTRLRPRTVPGGLRGCPVQRPPVRPAHPPRDDVRHDLLDIYAIHPHTAREPPARQQTMAAHRHTALVRSRRPPHTRAHSRLRRRPPTHRSGHARPSATRPRRIREGLFRNCATCATTAYSCAAHGHPRERQRQGSRRRAPAAPPRVFPPVISISSFEPLCHRCADCAGDCDPAVDVVGACSPTLRLFCTSICAKQLYLMT